MYSSRVGLTLHEERVVVGWGGEGGGGEEGGGGGVVGEVMTEKVMF